MSKCEKCQTEYEGYYECPVCNSNNNQNNKQPIYKNILFWLVLALIAIIVVLIIGISSNSESNSDTSSNTNNEYNANTTSNSNDTITTTTTTTTTKTLSDQEKMFIKIMTLIEEEKAYDAGDYIKGEVKPGEYAFVKFEGSGSYYCENDAAGNIVDNENFDSFGYVKVHGVGDLETRGVLISVDSFSELGVSGAKEIYEILNEQQDYNQGGYYKVGFDIEPGKYIVENIGGSGYYAVMSGPVGKSKIVKNDNFDGKKTVTLKKGQYLELSRSTYRKA